MQNKTIIVAIFCLLMISVGTVGKADQTEFDMTFEKAKIFMVFTTKGYMSKAPENLFTNDEVFRKLRETCKDVDFIVWDITKPDVTMEDIIADLNRRKENLDGVLIIGTLRPLIRGDSPYAGGGPFELATTGLPTIVVNNHLVFPWIPYNLFKTGKEVDLIRTGGPSYENVRVLTAVLDRRNQCKPSISQAMFDDLIYKIKLIEVLNKMKQTRILVVTPHKFLAFVDYSIGDTNKRFPEDYNERYRKALKETFGTELVMRPPEEFYEAFRNVDVKEAEQVADMWISEARELLDTTKSEVINTAKSYLAFDAMRRKYYCHAVSTHMRSFTGSGKTEHRFWPGLGLMELQKHGIQAICQEYSNIMVSHLIAYYFCGRPSMLGDIIFDTFNNLTILTHCGHPLNPWGDERRLEYTISCHAESPVGGTLKPGSSTGVRVFIPAGETVTTWKVYVLLKKIGVFTGVTVNPDDYYKDIHKGIHCRTKLITKVTDAEKIQNFYAVDSYGLHRTGTFGDFRQMIKDIAHLVGFKVVEEDK